MDGNYSTKNAMKKNKNSLSGNHIVQKSRPLLLMKSVDFNLGELKILDTYLSRINSHDEDSRAVSFTKHEYEMLMGITETRIETLKKYTKSMLSKIAEVPLDGDNFSQINLFCKSDFIKDETGQWRITLICSDAAKKIFFNIEELGYIRYRLKNVINLTSKYSVLLYFYLVDNHFRGSWTINLTDLREKILFCHNEYYKQFKNFNKEILKKCMAEINKMTDVNVEYTTVKSGRTVTAIKFDVVKDELLDSEVVVHSIPDVIVDETSEKKYSNEALEFLADACNYEFDDAEMKVLFDLIVKKINGNPSSDPLERHQYLSNKYHELELQATKREIRNRFAYLRKLIEVDIESEA